MYGLNKKKLLKLIYFSKDGINFQSNSSTNNVAIILKKDFECYTMPFLFHGGNMNFQADNELLAKIEELDNYIKNKYPKTKLKIHDFLEDLKAIEPNLTIIGLLNHLAEMYKEGSSHDEIIQDVDKTKKVFALASEYIGTLEKDATVSLLSKEIHNIILTHLERALQLYRDEYVILV